MPIERWRSRSADRKCKSTRTEGGVIAGASATVAYAAMPVCRIGQLAGAITRQTLWVCGD
jgi:hypothetical protein